VDYDLRKGILLFRKKYDGCNRYDGGQNLAGREEDIQIGVIFTMIRAINLLILLLELQTEFANMAAAYVKKSVQMTLNLCGKS